jgi:hypothetical protein
VAAADALDEGVSGDDDPGAAVAFEPAQRPQSGFQPAVIGLDAVVGVPISAMPSGGSNSPRTIGQVTALSVTTSTGRALVAATARSKKRRAAPWLWIDVRV